MKVLSRDFTIGEKVLILILIVVLLGLGYYFFVDQPVRSELESCAAEKIALQTELDAVTAKLTVIKKMRTELENIEHQGDVSVMRSYNASKEEIRRLNDVLAQATQYSIAFANVTKDGDQIRRNFSLQFTAPDYDTVSKIISDLSDSEIRCLVADITCSRGTRYIYGAYENTNDLPYTVSATATFYETMVGGTPDAGLPNG